MSGVWRPNVVEAADGDWWLEGELDPDAQTESVVDDIYPHPHPAHLVYPRLLLHPGYYYSTLHAPVVAPDFGDAYHDQIGSAGHQIVDPDTDQHFQAGEVASWVSRLSDCCTFVSSFD